MLSQLLRTQRRMRRTAIGTVVALALLLMTAFTAVATHNLGGPNAYRDCWLGNQERYDECVETNNWGANFVFPDRDDVSLTVGNIPSY